ncbi:MAG TPA: septal ring lytic transglycosylase RlpA family protein [Steroidobacteraceae bacterium]|nr:septal ring lytic transglycosylase RlpA family protein [Steroidobacteraceae bacterium]
MLFANVLVFGTVGALAHTAPAHTPYPRTEAARVRPSRTPVKPSHALRPAIIRLRPATVLRPDFSGRRRVGIASYYADWFAGRKMADGARMNPRSNNAASRTLPLGTIAKVTNLATHKSAVVTIQDRGPYVQGRIVDLSPSTARKIGITRKLGIAKVRVTPIAVPLPDGHVRLAFVPSKARPQRSLALR